MKIQTRQEKGGQHSGGCCDGRLLREPLMETHHVLARADDMLLEVIHAVTTLVQTKGREIDTIYYTLDPCGNRKSILR